MGIAAAFAAVAALPALFGCAGQRIPGGPVLNGRGWWSNTLEGLSAQRGDVFLHNVHGKHRSTIKVTETMPDQRVVWRVLDNQWNDEDDAEWTGTEVRFDIADRDGKTELTFTRLGLTPQLECYEGCRKGWGFYIETSLPELITTGMGQPVAAG